MNKKMEQWQENYIRFNAHAMTPAELAKALGLKRENVYAHCRSNGIKYKAFEPVKKDPEVVGKKYYSDKANRVPVQEKSTGKIQRPPAIYSNRSPYGISDEMKSLNQ